MRRRKFIALLTGLGLLPMAKPAPKTQLEEAWKHYCATYDGNGILSLKINGVEQDPAPFKTTLEGNPVFSCWENREASQ